MSKAGTVTIEVVCDTTPTEEALHRLKIAADEAREALERLGSVNHGSVHIVIAGSMVKCDVDPPRRHSVDGQDGPELIGLPKGHPGLTIV